jgi:hypothetical protein
LEGGEFKFVFTCEDTMVVSPTFALAPTIKKQNTVSKTFLMNQ